MMEQGLSVNQIISELTRSPHGDLSAYVPVGKRAAEEQPDLFAHIVAWNKRKGQIRDSKVALPVLAMPTNYVVPSNTMDEYRSNALAHIAMLDPRNFVRALDFARTENWHRQLYGRLVRRYLQHKEENWALWERSALQHRASMKRLYARYHVKPSTMAEQILFKRDYPKGTVFEIVANLKNMSPTEAAGHILERKIPFLIAAGALGDKMKDPATVLALISRMTAPELMNNSKMLERLGVKDNPSLRGAYEEALAKAAKSKKNTLKATKAAEIVGGTTAKKLRSVQEAQMDASAIEGNWLVLGDASPSMQEAIGQAVEVAAVLARMAKGQVHLVFFDDQPRFMDATGKTYEELKHMTRGVTAGGMGTSIGCGLLSAIEKSADIDGIAIVSDAGENRAPYFVDQYKALVQTLGKEIPVYLYRCATSMYMNPQWDLAGRMARAGLDLQEFDIRQGTDYYSLPNLVQTMRTNRYSLADEIYATPLVDLESVLPTRKEMAVA
jgi:hypothetical protein